MATQEERLRGTTQLGEALQIQRGVITYHGEYKEVNDLRTLVMENYPPYQVEYEGEAVDLVFGPRNSCLVILPITRSENIHVNARNKALQQWVKTGNLSNVQIYGYGFLRPENEEGSRASIPFYPVALVYEQSIPNTPNGPLHVVDIPIGEENKDATYVTSLGGDIIQTVKFGKLKKGENWLHPLTSGPRFHIWR